MPTYEYVCEKCGHEFEIFQSITAKSLTTCTKETCGRKTWGRGKVRKKISAGGGLLFKGTGFYNTDYRSESYKQAAQKAVTDSRPPAKSETAAAPKADKK